MKVFSTTTTTTKIFQQLNDQSFEEKIMNTNTHRSPSQKNYCFWIPFLPPIFFSYFSFTFTWVFCCSWIHFVFYSTYIHKTIVDDRMMSDCNKKQHIDKYIATAKLPNYIFSRTLVLMSECKMICTRDRGQNTGFPFFTCWLLHVSISK